MYTHNIIHKYTMRRLFGSKMYIDNINLFLTQKIDAPVNPRLMLEDCALSGVAWHIASVALRHLFTKIKKID